MLELTVCAPAFGEPTGSPFANKAICLLERAGRPCKVKHTNDSRKAPKGKLPVLQHDSQLIPDSDDIRDHLKGRHSAAERLARVNKDFTAPSALLGEQDFLFGAEATAADLSAAPMLRALNSFPPPTPMQCALRSHAYLVGYMERGKAAQYPKASPQSLSA
jgi:glutathione S-transferase